MSDYRLPEELRKIARRLVARQLVAPHLADDLRNKRVGVLAVQLVVARLERIENLRMVEDVSRLREAIRARRIAALAHKTRKVEERFGDAAELAPAHRRRLFGRERQHLLRRPVAEAPRDLKRLFVSAYLRLVEKPLENLVLNVPRCPDAYAGYDLVDVGRWKCPNPSGADRVLAALQFRDGDRGAGLHRLVACRLVERGHA